MAVASIAIGRNVGGVASIVAIVLLVLVAFAPLVLATQTAGTLTLDEQAIVVTWMGRETRVPYADVRRWRRVSRRLEITLADGDTIWLLPQQFVSGGESAGWLSDPEALSRLEGRLAPRVTAAP